MPIRFHPVQKKAVIVDLRKGFSIAQEGLTINGVPRKTSFASFSRYPAGLVYWGRGLTINGLRYS